LSDAQPPRDANDADGAEHPPEPVLVPAGQTAPTQREPTAGENAAGLFWTAIMIASPRPIVSYALLISCIGLFIAMLVSGVGIMKPEITDLLSWGANYSAMTLGGQWWRLFSSMFIHIGIIHVAFNMYVLWDIGPRLERLVGSGIFVAIYVVSGAAGSAASIWGNPNVVSAGASGAIFGLFGALGALLLLRRDLIPNEALAPMRNSTMAFVGYNLVFSSFIKGIDLAAHVGGLVGGFVAGLVIARFIDLRVKRPIWPALLVLPLAALAVFGALQAPNPAGDYLAKVRAFGAVESKVLAHVEAVLKSNNDAQVAKVLETQVLPVWKKALDDFVVDKRWPKHLQKTGNTLREYATLRLRAWKLVVRGVKEKKPTLIKRAQALQKQAERVAKSLSKK
jgi:rhomboid protease GluP